MMSSSKRWPWFAIPALFVLIAIIVRFYPEHRGAGARTADPTVTRKSRDTSPRAQAEGAIADVAAKRRISDDWMDLLQKLRSNPRPDANAVREILAALRIEWTSVNPRLLAEAIELLLESGEDAATGLGFKVGNHGFLAEWPTLRVFLLDVLAASDPEKAIRIARGVLEDARSAEEFATALRSLTREGIARADDAELLSRFNHLLSRQEWQASAGLAEALDLPRFIGTEDAARALAAWNGDRRMKSMAMHEFAAEYPHETIKMLRSEEGVDPATRAGLMARADPESPDQLAAVNLYLHDPAIAPEEAAAFLKMFPLRSATTGFRLYGKTPSPYSFERIAAGDRKALETANVWLADPALRKFHPDIESLKRRLEEWTGQAETE